MAPDLNSVPPSPRPPAATSASTAATNSSPPTSSRRVSQVMGPPPVPFSPPSAVASLHGHGDATNGIAIASGPLRHPRPLTAAELHLELEKEQEGMVNRLTRELSQLRQQTASVASTASSTSTNLNDSMDAVHGSHYISSAIHPTASRRHRSSSNLSAHLPLAQSARTGSVTGIAPSRDATLPSARPSGDFTRVARSREPSITSQRQSGRSSPSLSSSLQQQHGEHFPHFPGHSHRSSLSQSLPGTGEHPRTMSVSSTTGTSRYEEAAYHRAELETIKRENEMLRRRVRELESNLKSYRERESHPVNGQNESAVAASGLVDRMRDAALDDAR
ncbi:hypothetical protein DTO271G3_1156 [Paecilomyces variotii]|nr:hypothetical protein DTO271G3_1156 [Paecilomyces variotii]